MAKEYVCNDSAMPMLHLIRLRIRRKFGGEFRRGDAETKGVELLTRELAAIE